MMRRLLCLVLCSITLLLVTSVGVSAADTPQQSCSKSGGDWDGAKKECKFDNLSTVTGPLGPKIRACLGSDGIWNGESCATKGSHSDSLTTVIKNIINTLLFITGSIAVIIIIISGLRFVTANGDSASVSKAKNSIIYSLIGLVVAVSAYAIVNFILDQL